MLHPTYLTCYPYPSPYNLLFPSLCDTLTLKQTLFLLLQVSVLLLQCLNLLFHLGDDRLLLLAYLLALVETFLKLVKLCHQILSLHISISDTELLYLLLHLRVLDPLFDKQCL